VGPALAALVILTLGVATCFLANALSFTAMLVALRRMDPGQLEPAPVTPRGRGQLRDALRVVRATPALRTPLLLVAVVGTLSFNFTVVLPLLARFTLHGGASTYALLTSVMGAGAVIGALRNGARGAVSARLVAGAALGLGAAMAAVALAPSLPTVLLALFFVGASSVTFTSSLNAALQLAAEPALRGRVMALWSVVFLGSTPIGGPLVGWLSAVAGPRAGLLLGAGAALAAGAWIAVRDRRAPAVAPAGT
jgi:predicted MFS family arabinose efflux permease